MRIAAFQMPAIAGDVAGNLSIIADAAEQAGRRGADLLVLPELAIPGYGAGDAMARLARPAGAAEIGRLAAMAKTHDLGIVCGFAERTADGIYNSAVLVAPDGRRAVYRKCHLYGDYERRLFLPGGAAPDVVEFRGLRLGLLICYDVEFPETVRRLATAGADVVAVPTALPESGHAAFIAGQVVPVRAFENQVALAYANFAGADELFAYAGHSCIVMPDGTDGARAPAAQAGLIVADYEPARFASSRRANPYLADRRADLY